MNKILKLASFLILINSVYLHSQTTNNSTVILKPFSSINNNLASEKKSIYSDNYHLQELNLNVKEIEKFKNISEKLIVEIPIKKNEILEFELERQTISSNNFILTNHLGNPLEIPSNVNFFHGFSKTNPNERIAVSVFESKIDVLLETQNGKYSISESKIGEYKFEDVISKANAACGVVYDIKKDTEHKFSNHRVMANNGCKTFAMHATTDWTFFQRYGSYANCYYRMLTVVNQMNLVFQDAGVGIFVSGAQIFTSFDGSYLDRTSHQWLLNTHNNWYYSFSKPFAHFGLLFTEFEEPKIGGGSILGTAFVNANICNQTNASYTGWAKTTENWGYLCAAHEIGHILGRVHTSDNSIMDPTISTDKNRFNAASAISFQNGLGTCGIANHDFPANRLTENITANSARIKWERTSSGTQYTIHYRKVGEPSFISITVGSNITHILSNLLPNTQYEWGANSDCSPSTGFPTQFFTTEIEKTISIGPFSLNLCKSLSFNLNYSTTGTYNNGNVFIATLSDVNGNFYYNSTIGYSNNSSGAISIVIPEHISFGNGYKIKVGSTSPYIESNEIGPITISATCPPPCPMALTLSSSSSPSDDVSSGIVIKQTHNVNGIITAANKITGNANVTYMAGKSIILDPGFKADSGTIFKTEIGGCN